MIESVFFFDHFFFFYLNEIENDTHITISRINLATGDKFFCFFFLGGDIKSWSA